MKNILFIRNCQNYIQKMRMEDKMNPVVIISIVMRKPPLHLCTFTPMVLILGGHRIKLITQSFHIPLFVTRDSCEYCEVFILRKHIIKPMLRNWNWPNTYLKPCIFKKI